MHHEYRHTDFETCLRAFELQPVSERLQAHSEPAVQGTGRTGRAHRNGSGGPAGVGKKRRAPSLLRSSAAPPVKRGMGLAGAGGGRPVRQAALRAAKRMRRTGGDSDEEEEEEEEEEEGSRARGGSRGQSDGNGDRTGSGGRVTRIAKHGNGSGTGGGSARHSPATMRSTRNRGLGAAAFNPKFESESETSSSAPSISEPDSDDSCMAGGRRLGGSGARTRPGAGGSQAETAVTRGGAGSGSRAAAATASNAAGSGDSGYGGVGGRGQSAHVKKHYHTRHPGHRYGLASGLQGRRCTLHSRGWRGQRLWQRWHQCWQRLESACEDTTPSIPVTGKGFRVGASPS